MRLPRLPLQTWLTASHLLVLLLPVLVLLVSGGLMRDQIAQTTADAEHQAVWAARYAARELALERQTTPDATLADLRLRLSPVLEAVRESTLAGYMLTDPEGIVVAASGHRNHGRSMGRDALVQRALTGVAGADLREKDSPNVAVPLGSESRRAKVRVFVAEPIVVEGEVVGAVLVSRTPREEWQALYQILPGGLVPSLALSLLAVLLLAVLSAQVLSRSLARVARTARLIARGEQPPDALGTAGSHVAEVADLTASVGTMASRLSERLRYIGEFAGNVSHEFKTPLATLKGTIELLEDPEMPPPQRQRFLDNAGSEVERLDRMVTGLLDLARAEESATRESVDLAELVSGLDADEVIASGVANVRGDRAQLRVALQNLVQNARQHGAAPVEALLERSEHGVTVHITDHGPGISEGNRARVFDRFFTTDRLNGTGLGLALTRAVVEAHGGTLTFESAPGRTRFSLTLPALG